MIDLAEARGLLKAAMETQGRDFVYNIDGRSGPCCNVPIPTAGDDENEPRRKTGCIVGTAMKLSGRIPDDRWEGYEWGPVGVFYRFLTNDALTYLGIAQTRQDNGWTWGASFDDAEEFAVTGNMPMGVC